MRAVRYHGYKEVIRIEDVPRPKVPPGSVLVRVEAAALNPLDVKLHSGSMQWFFELALPYTMGSDLAGTVEEVGADVTAWHRGDRVIGRRAPLVGGAFADLAVVAAVDCAVLPGSMSAVTGAGIPTAAGTARAALFGSARLVKGQTVLIHAGAGGVGSFAVQFAKAAGAHVVATASGDGVALVRRLGADEVIDHRVEDFTRIVGGIDVVLDTVGSDTQERSFSVLRRGGRLVSVVSVPNEARARERGVTVERVYFKQEAGGLATLVDDVTRDALEVLVDVGVPLDRFDEAFSRQASGRARGKVILIP